MKTHFNIDMPADSVLSPDINMQGGTLRATWSSPDGMNVHVVTLTVTPQQVAILRKVIENAQDVGRLGKVGPALKVMGRTG